MLATINIERSKFEQLQEQNILIPGQSLIHTLNARWSPLTPESICLFSQGDGTFHWAIYIPITTTVVDKYHATNHSGGWVYEQVDYSDISQDMAISVVIITGVYYTLRTVRCD